MEQVKLNNGNEMPILGFGVYQVRPDQTETAVSTALKVGYRLIDTAEYYRNEAETGKAIAESGIPRNEVFITTKLPPQSSYESAKARIKESAAAIGNDYIDLMLIHWPGGDNVATYQALEDAQKEGIVKNIGLSSFYGRQYQEILDKCDIVPVVDQNETHVFRQQLDFQPVLEKNGTKLESWSPLAEASSRLMNNATLKKIAAAHNKTVAQIALKTLVQRGIIVIPKSTHESRMKENFDLFDFTLTDEEQKEIEKLDKGRSIFF